MEESIEQALFSIYFFSCYVSIPVIQEAGYEESMKKQEGDSPLVEICWQESNCLTVESPFVLQTHIQQSKCRFKYTDTKTRDEETFTLHSSGVTGLHCYEVKLSYFVATVMTTQVVCDNLCSSHSSGRLSETPSTIDTTIKRLSCV